MDHGWHACYLALYLLDGMPRSVRAQTSQRRFTDSAVEDTAEMQIEFPGVAVEVSLTWAAESRGSRGRIEGEHGTIEIADRSLIVRIADREPVETTFAQPLSAGSYHPDWFAPLVEDFRAELLDPALRGGNLREAEATCRLIDLAYRSHAAGGVRLPFEDEPLEGADPGAGE
jgi:predicted dehydrogenase